MKIFDDAFVDANVYSGLEVDPQHRQNLAELVLGEQGVQLARNLQSIIAQDDENGKIRSAKEQAIPSEKRRGLAVRAFCDLPKLPDIDIRIRDTERNLQATRERDVVQATDAFDGIALPAIDIAAIKQVLPRDLAGLDSEAESKVREHIASLTNVDEQWIAAGMDDNLQKAESKCPFCGQDTDGITLVTHYRAYFSEAYAELKQDISHTIENLRNIHAEEARLKFAESMRDAERKYAFWSRFCDIPPISVNIDAVVRDWNTALDAMLSVLQSKQVAPLEKFSIADKDAIAVDQYNVHRQQIITLNKNLQDSNNMIIEIKKNAIIANTNDMENDLSRLLAAKDRHSEHISLLCSDYILADDAKRFSASERNKARKALDKHREVAFPAMRVAVNEYIARFNTGFYIDSLTHSNTRGGPSCTYNVLINNTAVAVAGNKASSGRPAFRNTLSAGDRSTLALAFFFASLNQNPNLANTTVVMDDPMSSLDDHRSFATIREISNLLRQAKQVIVLSHSKKFLCDVWNAIPRNSDCATMEIVKAGEESRLQCWNIHQDSITEHDRRHTMLQEYIKTGSGNRGEIARAIRPHLESFLRIACPEFFPPGTMLGQFLGRCRNADPSEEILTKAATEKLTQIVRYANQFHHDSTTPHLNDAELRGFVRRTLDFVGTSNL